MERSAGVDGDQRLADRERRTAVGQADLDDRLDALGDQQVAEGVAVALGDRDRVEVVGAVTSTVGRRAPAAGAPRAPAPNGVLCASRLACR
jgi:hypothetical protein